MITEIQRAEIRNYLLSKKLPIDLLIEIQDHFESQINDDIIENEIDFGQAFENVKQTWFSELRFSKYNIQFDLNDRTYFEKRIKAVQQKVLLKKSFLTVLSFLIILGLSTYLLSEKTFHYFFLGLVVFSILFPVFNYYRRFNLFKLMKKYDNYQLTWSQEYTRLSIFFAGLGSSFLYNIAGHTHSIYTAFHKIYFDLSSVSLCLLIFLFWLNCYCYYTQEDFLKQIKKVQPYLKYLKPS